MHIRVKVDEGIRVRDLVTKISQIREVNIDGSQKSSEVVILMFNPKTKAVSYFFNPTDSINSNALMGRDLIAIEVLTRPGRELIKKFYCDN